MKTTSILATCFVATLIGCGGGGSGTSPSTTTPTAVTPVTPVTTNTPTPMRIYPGEFRAITSEATASAMTLSGRASALTLSTNGSVDRTSVGNSASALTLTGGASKLCRGRVNSASALLPDGRALIIGGYNHNDYCVETDFFDPTTETFTQGPSLNVPRSGAKAFNVPGGVLVVGGAAGEIITSEFLDFNTMTFTVNPGPFTFVGSGANVILLEDGETFFVMGGAKKSSSGSTYNDTPIYPYNDIPMPPSLVNWKTGQTEFLVEPTPGYYFRGGSVLVQLPNHKILIVGGTSDPKEVTEQQRDHLAKTSLIFDPATKAFSETSKMNVGRILHTAIMLANGKVGIYGGVTKNMNATTENNSPSVSVSREQSVEMYDYVDNVFTLGAPTGIQMENHRSIILSNGLTMHTSGDQSNAYITTIYIHDNIKDEYGCTASMKQERYQCTFTSLLNGKVLVTGGRSSKITSATTGEAVYLDTAEIFDTKSPLQISFDKAAVNFEGIVTFKASLPVTWTCSNGTITENGVFTAPYESAEVWVTATSKADNAVIAQGMVKVTP